MSAERATGLPANDKAGIRSHVMIHSLAGPLAREGKLVARFLGEDANGTHPRTGKSGIKLTPVVPHFVIGDGESARNSAWATGASVMIDLTRYRQREGRSIDRRLRWNPPMTAAEIVAMLDSRDHTGRVTEVP